jgi:hypothetical protein
VKGIKYLDLKDELLGLVDHWQAYVKRRLQYFVEMVLFPLFGYGKHKVRIQFDVCWLDAREFTTMSNHMTAEAFVITLASSLHPYKKLHRR